MDSNSISLAPPAAIDTNATVSMGAQMEELLGALDAAGTAAVQEGMRAASVMPEGAPGATSAVMTGDAPAMENQAALQPNGDVRPPVKMLDTVSLNDIRKVANFIAKAELAAIDPQIVSLSDMTWAASDMSPTALKIATSALAAKPNLGGGMDGGTPARLAPGAVQIAKDGLAGAVASANADAARTGQTSQRMGLVPVAPASDDPIVLASAADTAALVEDITASVPGATAETSKISAKIASSAASAQQLASLTDGSAPKTTEQVVNDWTKAFVETYNAWLQILSPPRPSGPGPIPSNVAVGTPPAVMIGTPGTKAGDLDIPTHSGHRGGREIDEEDQEPNEERGLSFPALPKRTWDGTASNPLSGMVPSQGDEEDEEGSCSAHPYPAYPSYPATPAYPATDQYGTGHYKTDQNNLDPHPYGTAPMGLSPQQQAALMQQQEAQMQAWRQQQAYEQQQREAEAESYLLALVTASVTIGRISGGSNSAYEINMRSRATEIELELAARRATND